MNTSELADMIHAAIRTTNNAAYLDGRDGGSGDAQRQAERQAAHLAQNEAVCAMWKAFYENAYENAKNEPPF